MKDSKSVSANVRKLWQTLAESYLENHPDRQRLLELPREFLFTHIAADLILDSHKGVPEALTVTQHPYFKTFVKKITH